MPIPRPRAVRFVTVSRAGLDKLSALRSTDVSAAFLAISCSALLIFPAPDPVGFLPRLPYQRINADY
jgi:hypothetical protein